MAASPVPSLLPVEAPPAATNLPLIAWHASGITKILQEETAKLENERKRLEQERATFEAMKAKIASIHFPEKLKLNVGGQLFATSRESLLREKDSLFSSMFSGRGFKVEPDEEGAYFIDRDGTHFRHILNYLRSGKVYIPEDRQDFEELLGELEFYHISTYQSAILSATQVDCTFDRIGDTNGVFYWLGTSGKQQGIWSNPVTAGKVHLTVAGGSWFGSVLGTSVERSPTPINGGICKLPQPAAASAFGAPAAGGGLFGAVAPAASFGAPSAAPAVTFGAAPSSNAHFQLWLPFPVLLTGYTARRGNCQPPSNWKLEGSIDGVTWTTVRAHENDTALQNASEAYWETPSVTELYRYFRWSSSAPNQCLHLSCIELYGAFPKPSGAVAAPSSPGHLLGPKRVFLKPRKTEP